MRRAVPCLPSRTLIASGTSGAPTSPCAARAAIKVDTVGAAAHAADVTTKPIMLTVYTRRVPNLRARYEVAASPAARASR
jgi:hypothetical protein